MSCWEEITLIFLLFKRKRLCSWLVTPDLVKRPNKNKTPLKKGTKFTGNFTFLVIRLYKPLGLKVQTRAMLEQKMLSIKIEQLGTIIEKWHNTLIKDVSTTNHNILVFDLPSQKIIKYPVCSFLPASFSNDDTNNLFTPWKFGLVK